MPRTCFSPTRIWRVRPLGITCAKSPSLTVWGLLLSGWTRRLSRTSGLKRPPARSLERSFFRRSTAVSMSDSREEKSKGSSFPGVALPLPDSLAGDACFSSRAALPPFLRRHGEVLKRDRWGGRGGWARCRAVLRPDGRRPPRCLGIAHAALEAFMMASQLPMPRDSTAIRASRHNARSVCIFGRV
jgi:hypothetical protein